MINIWSMSKKANDAGAGVYDASRGRIVVDFQAAVEACKAKVATDPRHAAVNRAFMDALLGGCEG